MEQAFQKNNKVFLNVIHLLQIAKGEKSCPICSEIWNNCFSIKVGASVATINYKWLKKMEYIEHLEQIIGKIVDCKENKKEKVIFT